MFLLFVFVCLLDSDCIGIMFDYLQSALLESLCSDHSLSFPGHTTLQDRCRLCGSLLWSTGYFSSRVSVPE